MLDSMLSEDVRIMPCKGILKACAMSLPVSCKSKFNSILDPTACTTVSSLSLGLLLIIYLRKLFVSTAYFFNF